MWRDALARGHAGCACIAEEGLREDRLREPLALYAYEERRLKITGADAEVVDEERFEGRVDRNDPVPAALRAPHLKQRRSRSTSCQSSPSSSLRRRPA
jgi:hypothetical protein